MTHRRLKLAFVVMDVSGELGKKSHFNRIRCE